MRGQLALLKRAVLTDSRAISNYLTWLGGGILVFILFLQISDSRVFTGLTFLKSITFLNLFIITITGVIGFSSSITEEKEENTLGLLMMSGISSKTLIFSKASARVIRGIFLTLSQLPFVIISIAFGGISLSQIFALYTTLISYIIFLAFFCSLFSVICKTTAKAAFASASLLFLAFIFTIDASPAIGYIINPARTLDYVLKNGFAEYFIIEQIILYLGLAGFSYLLSIKAFETAKDPQPIIPKINKETSKKSSKSRSWSNALCWKDFNYMYGGKTWWTWQVIIIIAITSVYLSDYNSVTTERFMEAILVVAPQFLFLQLIFVAQNLISKEFKQKTHAALFTLPCDLKNILKNKLYAGLFATLASLLITIYAVLYLSSAEREAYMFIIIILSYELLYLSMTFYLSVKINLFAFALAGLGTFLYGLLSALLVSSFGSIESVTIFLAMFNGLGIFTCITLACNNIYAKASQN